MNTEKVYLDEDITVFFVKAEHFPEGIAAAHQKLHALFSSPQNRLFFGISYADNTGMIHYLAATAETFHGEAKKMGLETFVIKKGVYHSTLLLNYRKDLEDIRRAFQKLLDSPLIDPQGYCVEMYMGSSDLRCMVRLKTGA